MLAKTRGWLTYGNVMGGSASDDGRGGVQGRRMMQATATTVRLARPDDLGMLQRLIERDSGRAETRQILLDLTKRGTPSRILVASAGGDPIAALHIDYGHSAADPFVNSRAALELLQAKAGQLRGERPRRGRVQFTLRRAPKLGWRIAATAVLGTVAALLAAPGANAATTCQFDDPSDALNVQLSADNDRAQLRVDAGGTIVVASATSVDIACTGGSAATTTIDTVNVSDTSGGGSTVTTIVQPASFSPGKTVEGSGPGSEIEFNVDLGGGFSDRLSLFGSGGVDNWRLGTAGINFNSGNVDPAPDADTPTLTGVDSYAAQAEGGSDQISAQGGVGAGSAFGSPLTLDGGPGNDNLGGANTAPGALGDIIDGGPDTDNLHGFAGSDLFKGSTGANFLDGGSGEDTVSYAEASAPGGVAVDLGVATQQNTGVGSDNFFGVENVNGTNGPDRLFGDGGPNVLRAGEGDDRVEGRGGNDEVAANGGANDGADTLAGGAGDDDIFGGSGVNTLTYAGSPSAVTVDLTPDPTFGYGRASGEGNDKLFGIQNLIGSPFADTLVGNAQANTIVGGPGGDTIRAVAGPDTVEVRDGEADTASCGTELDTATADRASLDTVDPDCETTSFLPEPDPDPGQGGGDPQTGGDAEVSFDLSGKAKQPVVKRKAVVVSASCPLEDCTVAASGGRRLRRVAESLTAGTPERIKLRVKRTQLLKIAAALRDGRKPKLAVTARAADAVGNAATDSVTVRARRSR